MHPILVSFGPITLYTYGLLIACAFLASTLLAVRLAKDEGIDSQTVYDLAFWVIIGAIIGARLLYVIVEYKTFANAPLDAFKIWNGGLVYFGGLMGALVSALFFLRKNRINYLRMGDVAAPCIALGQAIGRLGCFAAGCCYGSPSDLPWAVMFEDHDSLAPLGVHLHPAQIYSVLMNIGIFGVLLFLRKRALFTGQIFFSYLILYSTGRFIVEFFRSDERGSVLDGLFSTSQFISVVLFAIGVALFAFFLRKAKKEFK